MTIDPRELWDYAHIAAYAKMAENYVQNKIAVQPGSPTPIKVMGPNAHPRYIAGEVMAFFEARKVAA